MNEKQYEIEVSHEELVESMKESAEHATEREWPVDAPQPTNPTAGDENVSYLQVPRVGMMRHDVLRRVGELQEFRRKQEEEALRIEREIETLRHRQSKHEHAVRIADGYIKAGRDYVRRLEDMDIG